MIALALGPGPNILSGGEVNLIGCEDQLNPACNVHKMCVCVCVSPSTFSHLQFQDVEKEHMFSFFLIIKQPCCCRCSKLSLCLI